MGPPRPREAGGETGQPAPAPALAWRARNTVSRATEAGVSSDCPPSVNRWTVPFSFDVGMFRTPSAGFSFIADPIYRKPAALSTSFWPFSPIVDRFPQEVETGTTDHLRRRYRRGPEIPAGPATRPFPSPGAGAH